MLAYAPGVGYIGEPFSPATPAGICSSRFPNWYMYVDDELGLTYRESLDRTLSFRYDVSGALAARPHPRRVARNVMDASHFLLCRVRRCRPLMKDPLALLSADWLAANFDMDVVVMVRHPAAFAASLKVKGWAFPFDHFTRQVELMRSHLSPFLSEIERTVRSEQDIIAQAILLWRILRHVIDEYRECFSDWIFVRHEDLALDPIGGFTELYRTLGLSLTDSAVREIKSSSGGPSLGEHDAVSGIVRDSAKSISTWRTRLSGSEIERIHLGGGDIGLRFYEEDEW